MTTPINTHNANHEDTFMSLIKSFGIGATTLFAVLASVTGASAQQLTPQLCSPQASLQSMGQVTQVEAATAGDHGPDCALPNGKGIYVLGGTGPGAFVPVTALGGPVSGSCAQLLGQLKKASADFDRDSAEMKSSDLSKFFEANRLATAAAGQKLAIQTQLDQQGCPGAGNNLSGGTQHAAPAASAPATPVSQPVAGNSAPNPSGSGMTVVAGRAFDLHSDQGRAALVQACEDRGGALACGRGGRFITALLQSQ
jgi:hypothetical protein